MRAGLIRLQSMSVPLYPKVIDAKTDPSEQVAARWPRAVSADLSSPAKTRCHFSIRPLQGQKNEIGGQKAVLVLPWRITTNPA